MRNITQDTVQQLLTNQKRILDLLLKLTESNDNSRGDRESVKKHVRREVSMMIIEFAANDELKDLITFDETTYKLMMGADSNPAFIKASFLEKKVDALMAILPKKVKREVKREVKPKILSSIIELRALKDPNVSNRDKILRLSKVRENIVYAREYYMIRTLTRDIGKTAMVNRILSIMHELITIVENWRYHVVKAESSMVNQNYQGVQ